MCRLSVACLINPLTPTVSVRITLLPTTQRDCGGYRVNGLFAFVLHEENLLDFTYILCLCRYFVTTSRPMQSLVSSDLGKSSKDGPSHKERDGP